MFPRETQLPFPTPADPPAGGLAPRRWQALAAGAGLTGREELLLALSGGADSVYLLHVLARADPRPRFHALHLDHGLRGTESAADAAFCQALCRELGVPLEIERLDLGPPAPDLERRARVARYRALARTAARLGLGWIATGHHADDSLETLLLRWTRGTRLGGFAGVPARTRLPPAHTRRTQRAPMQVDGAPTAGDAARAGLASKAGDSDGADWLNPTARELHVVRPLLGLRREEVRETLRSAGLTWREDASNASAAFSRNRVRHLLLPALEAAAGEEALEHLARFASTVEEFERECARSTAAIAWGPPRHAAARRSGSNWNRGGSLRRAELARLPGPLLQRVLARLFLEGTGLQPRRVHVARLVEALRTGRSAVEELHSGWRVHLAPGWLHLDPPHAPAEAPPRRRRSTHQLALPFEDGSAVGVSVPEDQELPAWRLDLPGKVELPDGRVVLGERVRLPPGTPFPRGLECVELDAEGLGGHLEVRWPWPGGRFHPLGATGSRPLGRFLRDAGVPHADRSRVPLVCLGNEVLWVAGLRPAESRRLGSGTVERVRLRLEALPT